MVQHGSVPFRAMDQRFALFLTSLCYVESHDSSTTKKSFWFCCFSIEYSHLTEVWISHFEAMWTAIYAPVARFFLYLQLHDAFCAKSSELCKMQPFSSVRYSMKQRRKLNAYWGGGVWNYWNHFNPNCFLAALAHL